MTSPESPSSLLERAADLIENLACGATAGPWEGVVDNHGRGTINASVWADSIHYYITETITSGERHEADAKWIGVMSPSVATPLVAWLRDAARRMELHPHLSPEGSTMQRTALEFARLILKETQ